MGCRSCYLSCDTGWRSLDSCTETGFQRSVVAMSGWNSYSSAHGSRGSSEDMNQSSAPNTASGPWVSSPKSSGNNARRTPESSSSPSSVNQAKAGSWGDSSNTSSGDTYSNGRKDSSSSRTAWQGRKSDNNDDRSRPASASASPWANSSNDRHRQFENRGHNSGPGNQRTSPYTTRPTSTSNSNNSTGWESSPNRPPRQGKHDDMGWGAVSEDAHNNMATNVGWGGTSNNGNSGSNGMATKSDWLDDQSNGTAWVNHNNSRNSWSDPPASTSATEPSLPSAPSSSWGELAPAPSDVWDSAEQPSENWDWAALSKKWEDEREKKLKSLRPTFEFAERDPKVEAKLFADSQSSGNRFKDLDVPVDITGDDVPGPIQTFESANLFWLLRENVALCKYDCPMPVQKYSIPIIMAGRDLTASAATGSGKTAAFLIPILDVVLRGGPCDVVPIIQDDLLQIVHPLILILEPTRELAQQVYTELKKFSYRSWIRSRIVYGGTPLDDQVRRLKGLGVDLLIATPGRLQDLIDRGVIGLNKLRCLVIDEADRMLDMGFLPAIRNLTSTDMPTSKQGRQTVLFSATFPARVEELVREFQAPSAIRLKVGVVGSLATTVTQGMIKTTRNTKEDVLLRVLKENPPSRTYSTLIFVDSKAKADELTTLLQKHLPLTIGIACMRGGMDQWAREASLSKFRSKDAQVLVATAVASRGLDVPSVEHVINYDLPKDDDDYIHRCGRTGRAGYEGKATTLFQAGRDEYSLANLVRRGTFDVNDVKKWLGDEVARNVEYEIAHPRPPPSFAGRGGKAKMYLP
ncbi:hypothetical protein SeMB42_g05622 [Synchytrium endobioticum]|uniref:RNA helicase n=1 Tax=Synchytrium endobioticum TaxID=286115 RepID=A0A507DI86_9FUNG|nr:hypothetical protein SeMB42_g05622 [Synchytrium endobioticum]TPX50608.1 hypothetical protein SeLEV6574_g00816 [Synchytrium endobioticum]